MTTCTHCLLTDRYPGITFDEQGSCSLCRSRRVFQPIGEDKLRELFDGIRGKNHPFDVMVPLSGGKDSTYILHLAVQVYKLKTLAMTYDNGFFSEIALDNISRAIAKTGVEHVFVKPDKALQKKVYRIMLTSSGDMCGACDIATKVNILDVALKYRIPAVLYGNSPLENDSFVPDSIQDIARCSFILRRSGEMTSAEINRFLIYPRLNLFSLSLGKRTGRFPKEISPLFYIPNPSDREMGEIIARELDWQDDHSRGYSKHFDCIAEPLTNYIRQKIYGYERRICQYSNMIRRHEITREEAEQQYREDAAEIKPAHTDEILSSLGIAPDALDAIEKIPPLRFESYTSKPDRLFKWLMRVIHPQSTS